MIQAKDEQKIEELKKKLGAKTKVEVVRAGLQLLEAEAQRRDRVQRWRRAAALVSAQSSELNAEFRRHSRLKRS